MTPAITAIYDRVNGDKCDQVRKTRLSWGNHSYSCTGNLRENTFKQPRLFYYHCIVLCCGGGSAERGGVTGQLSQVAAKQERK